MPEARDQAQLTSKDGKDTGSARRAGCGGGDKAGGDSHSTGKDDMPWGNKNLPHCSIENGYTCPDQGP
jgi:hypothetical protein